MYRLDYMFFKMLNFGLCII
ncbi:hypothetical protein F383_26237 [Gossypium arboreum]|uniref:Uncharacterized protein n=1 Tax=Gossypium arboreum TaxID=29729 RepID=A0A0B0P2V2_GOSAR|nr:hypothetical protein F383_26237 [Gossypium arboreum]